MKKILFVTWDAASSNYLENLFLPIFKGVKDSYGIDIHVMQFSWAGPEEVKRLHRLAEGMGIAYVQYPVHKRPHALLGVLWTVYTGVYHIRNYVKEHGIQVVMPRSTMPGMMVNRLRDFLKSQKVEVVFDADGLPLQERLDYTDLKASSRQYKFLKKEETRLLKSADKVLVRTQKSIDIHLANIGVAHLPKFHMVSNGRDAGFFRPDKQAGLTIRESLGVKPTEVLFVYSGSIGPQYMLEEMIALFHHYVKRHGQAKFLIISRSQSQVQSAIPQDLENLVIPISVDFQEIPAYLSAADVGLNFRLSAPSLAGIAPIKLGEYLMMGIPTLTTSGIGDIEDLLLQSGQDVEKVFCYVLDLKDKLYKEKAVHWIKEVVPGLDRGLIRDFGVKHFGLDSSVRHYGKALGF